jgi:hypothetical protein
MSGDGKRGGAQRVSTRAHPRLHKVEANHIVGKLMGDLLDYAVEIGSVIEGTQWYEECRKIIERLKQNRPVPETGRPGGALRRKGF